MTDPSPHAAAPLPNHFPWQSCFMIHRHTDVTVTLEDLPVSTEAILPARDREWVLRVFLVPYGTHSVRYEEFIEDTFNEVVSDLLADLRMLEHFHQRLREGRPSVWARNSVRRKIARLQPIIDEQRAEFARRIRDNLGLIAEYNQELYAEFRRPEVQAVPDQIVQATAAEDWTELRNAVFFFPEYTAYAPHGDIARALDRLAEALTTRRLPAVPMRQPPDDPEEEPQLGANWIFQMHSLRDACQLIHDDPRATQTFQTFAVGVLHTESLYEDDLQKAGRFVRINQDDFNLLGEHMVRRARDRAWERVRERFALRLVSWARRYPECRLAALADAPLDVARHIAALRFPYAPYPN